MRTFVYVDGFNFYHLRLKAQREYRWLNLYKLALTLLKADPAILRVKYYTARVSAKIDPYAPSRQQTYLAALGTIPEIETCFGNFLFSEKMAFLCNPPVASPAHYSWNLPPPRLVKIAKAEEKGSDVNLASHLVRDALLDRFDQALVLSNDTDLVEPIRIVTQEIGKPVGVIAPRRQRGASPPIPSPSLRRVSTFVVQIDDWQLKAAQFPDEIRTTNGKRLIRPENWT